ncbi:MAG: type II secretion system F family protein [Alphaproteobacteria bacterium]|nr:type II secretion system F family protein [Alphaproteobacteria bacterium]
MMGITVFIVALILAVAIGASVVLSGQQKKRDRYMAVIARDGAMIGRDDKDKLARQRSDNIARKLKAAGAEEASKKKDKDRTSIRQLMEQAGYEAPLSRYWIFSAIFALIVFGLLKLTSWPSIAVFFVTFTAFAGVPRFFLKWKAGRRQRKFLELFADALDASVRLLQAGMPISEAVAMVAREFESPLRDEMMRIYENQKIGVPLGEAALQMARRIPLPEVHMFATALQIQSETGSSLSEVLSNLSSVIRARFRLKRKIRALSSEAKASAAIIAALPPLVCLGLYAVNPEYISILFTLPKGKMLLGGAIFWMSCGILIMKQMINFKV